MATTTQITNIAHLLDLTDYAGEFIGDYDMDAVHRDYVELLNCDLPDGIDLLANGDVIADLSLADQARDIDWVDFTNERNVESIFDRHDKTAGLLAEVAAATAAVAAAEQRRVDAVRTAKDFGRYAVADIAAAAGITRDGVYKMLYRGISGSSKRS